MNSFTLYTQEGCVYCGSATMLLEKFNQAVNVVDINESPEAKTYMKENGLTTVPQIYHNGKHVGGYEDLVVYLQGDV